LDYRYFCLTAHYRTQLNFTLENLDAAKTSLQRLKNIISEIKDDNKLNEKYLKEFVTAINDDLDMPKALAVLWKLLRDEKAIGKIKTIEKIDLIFGLDLLKKNEIEIPNEVQKTVNERENARKNKDFKKSDILRDKIKELGYKVDDAKDGVKISKI